MQSNFLVDVMATIALNSSAPQLHFCKYHSIYFGHLFESEQNVRGERH